MEWDEKVFDFGCSKMKFLKVKNVTNLPHDECRLWAIEWKSALAFVEFILSGDMLSNVSILEIGAGSGFVGVASAVKQGNVCITDRVKAAIDLIRKNLELNNVEAETAILDWNKLDDFSHEPFEIIFGSDVLYQSRNAEAIVTILLSNILKEGGGALIFCPGRGYAERLERLSNSNSNLKAKFYLLENVKLKYCDMAELHIVEIFKQFDKATPSVKSLFDELHRFVQKHANETQL